MTESERPTGLGVVPGQMSKPHGPIENLGRVRVVVE
jgi:hypothetical protein